MWREESLHTCVCSFIRLYMIVLLLNLDRPLRRRSIQLLPPYKQQRCFPCESISKIWRVVLYSEWIEWKYPFPVFQGWLHSSLVRESKNITSHAIRKKLIAYNLPLTFVLGVCLNSQYERFSRALYRFSIWRKESFCGSAAHIGRRNGEQGCNVEKSLPCGLTEATHRFIRYGSRRVTAEPSRTATVRVRTREQVRVFLKKNGTHIAKRALPSTHAPEYMRHWGWCRA